MSRRRQAGYTLVELMMALSLFIAGMVALVGMQKLQVRANSDARSLAVAQRIAETWAGQLQMASLAWVDDPTFAPWLGTVGGGWTRPVPVAGRVGAAFDGVGNPLPDTALAQARYCTNIRLTYLYPNDFPVAGNGLMRAEIRVFWLRDGESTLDAAAGLCPTAPTAADLILVGKSSERYEFVYHTTGIRQHPG
ncbi:MAG TPA: prepilin-type N-terminal cleavage/methylation domain-containing protein [Polyangiaceae bacterium]